MAKQATSNDDKQAAPQAKGHPFLFGCLVGLLVGVALGWWFRPPDSFPLEELRIATEKQFLETKDQSRERLAEFAQRLAEQLRDE